MLSHPLAALTIHAATPLERLRGERSPGADRTQSNLAPPGADAITINVQRKCTAPEIIAVPLIGLAIAVVLYIVAVALLLLIGRRVAAKEIALLLPNLLILFKGLARDARVPRGSKALLVFGAVWFASPIDLIPEFIPYSDLSTMRLSPPSSSATYCAKPDEMSSPSTGAATPAHSTRCCASPEAELDPNGERPPKPP